jgi:uncharacterized protein (DUF433 family)
VLPSTPYLEARNGGYYVAGSRIGLAVIAHEFRRGRSAEAIFETYPSVGSLAKVYGVITFILEHPAEVEAYLNEEERVFEALQARYPLSEDLLERFEQARNEAPPKVA